MTTWADVMRECALIYGDHGVHVLPLHYPDDGGCSCDDAACSSIGKHPIHASGSFFGGATIDRDEIRELWTLHPGANIGIALTPSRLCVMDIDDPDPQAALERMPLDDWPPTATANTGSGGAHLYCRVPDGRKARGTVRAREGIDLRNGIVVAPPSRHASGGLYRFPRGTALMRGGEWVIPPAPEWMLHRPPAATGARDRGAPAPAYDLIAPVGRNDEYAETLVNQLIDQVARARRGDRDRAMFGAARSAAWHHARGLLPDLRDALRAIAGAAAAAYGTRSSTELMKLERATTWRPDTEEA